VQIVPGEGAGGQLSTRPAQADHLERWHLSFLDALDDNNRHAAVSFASHAGMVVGRKELKMIFTSRQF